MVLEDAIIGGGQQIEDDGEIHEDDEEGAEYLDNQPPQPPQMHKQQDNGQDLTIQQQQ